MIINKSNDIYNEKKTCMIRQEQDIKSYEFRINKTKTPLNMYFIV